MRFGGVCACVNFFSGLINVNIYFEGWGWEGYVYFYFVECRKWLM